MEGGKFSFTFLMIIITMVIKIGEAQLSENFYSSSCPSVESLVRQAVAQKYNQTFVTPPATLRLFFHDCFVQGCDASIMIYSPAGDAEKDSPDDVSLAGDGFDTIVKAKEAVEAVCPGVVSCADILALAARDAIVLTGGPSFNVELGRRDGVRSQASDVAGNLPQPTFMLGDLLNMFKEHGLDQTDLIALSGAHTFGAAHCSKFSNRLYNFSSSTPTDPTMNAAYAEHLKQQCPPDVDPNMAVFMEPLTPQTFDNKYYQDLVEGKGLFTSDQDLYTNPASKPTVIDFANNPDHFYAAFVTAIRKLGRVGVKTGDQGEIRKNCATYNS